MLTELLGKSVPRNHFPTSSDICNAVVPACILPNATERDLPPVQAAFAALPLTSEFVTETK